MAPAIYLRLPLSCLAVDIFSLPTNTVLLSWSSSIRGLTKLTQHDSMALTRQRELARNRLLVGAANGRTCVREIFYANYAHNETLGFTRLACYITSIQMIA